MVPPLIPLLTEHPLHPIHRPVEGGPEVVTLTPPHDVGRTVDVDDDLDLLRVLLVGVHDLGRGGSLLEPAEALDEGSGAVAYAIGYLAVALGDRDSHLVIRIERSPRAGPQS